MVKGHNEPSPQINRDHNNKGRSLYDWLYRMAQNKIPQQTICNISATSGVILKKILESA